MKIAFVIRSLNCAGAERQLVLLAHGLRQRGHSVSVTVFYGGGFFEPVLREYGIRVNVIGKRSRWDLIGSLARASRLLRAESPDVIHAYMGLANTVVALLKRRLQPSKIVWGIRGTEVDVKNYNWLTGVGTRLETALSGRADLVISNSHAGKRVVVQRRYPASRVTVVPNGYRPKEFFVDLQARRNVRALWKIRDHEILIGRVGRLDPQKDYPTFIRAAALAAARNPKLRFICIGSGSAHYSDCLRQLAVEYGISDRMIWTGFLDNMREAYNGLDLLVSSSQFGEGFPNVILEAMACGVPCVTTPVGDSAEVTGELGLCVPTKNPAALAEACVTLLQRLPSRDLVHDFVYERYRDDLLVERTERLLLGLIGKPKESLHSSGMLRRCTSLTS